MLQSEETFLRNKAENFLILNFEILVCRIINNEISFIDNTSLFPIIK